jgi:hypothetical protein
MLVCYSIQSSTLLSFFVYRSVVSAVVAFQLFAIDLSQAVEDPVQSVG